MELKKSIVYFYTVQKQLQIPVNRYLFKLRCNAIDYFENIKQEVKTNVMSLLYLHYTLFPSHKIESIRKLHLEDFDSFRFVFIDGIYHFTHPKVIFSIRSLSKAFYLKEYATKVDTYYVRFLSKERAFFKSFFPQAGAYLYIPAGMFVDKPIEILYLSTVTNTKSILFHTLNLIILGEGSCVQIIERHKNYRKGIEKFNSVTEVYMHESSYLDYCKIKDDRPTTYLLDHTCILQEDRSECNINTFSFSGEEILNYFYIYQCGKEIHSHINGLSILKEKINHNTFIEHVFPNGKSRDVYKGIFDKMANGIFNGKIIVLPSAKKTNASQKSTNILLSNKANVKANPHLEIFSEDVKCSHGCIIGELNTKIIFYLRSRGIPKEEAITQLLFSFAKDILECLSFQILKNFIFKNIIYNVVHSRSS